MNAVKVLATAGAFCVLVTMGCSGSGGNPPTATPATQSSPAIGDCYLAASGADVEVGVDSPVSSCAQWVSDLAGNGLNWYLITALAAPGSPPVNGTSPYAVACDLASDGQELYIIDTGGVTYGNNLCSQEEQNGWTPESAPGPIDAQGQQQEAAQVQASASAAQASASASASGQAASDDAAVKNDTATLTRDYTTWQNDVNTAQSDLSKVQGEPKCQGGTTDQNAYDDAQNVYDDGQAVYDDEQQLSSDVSSAQSNASGLSGWAQYAQDLKAVKFAMAHAQSAISENESSNVQQAATGVQDDIDSSCP